MSVHKRYYAAAAMEVASGVMDQALWIKARVEAGNDEEAHRLYLQLRAEELAKEGVKDQALGWLAKLGQLWHGAPSRQNPHPRMEGPVPRTFGGLMLIGIVVFMIAAYNEHQGRLAPKPTASNPIRNQALDFDGVVLGRPDVNVHQEWPGISCRTFEKAGYICEGSTRTIEVGGINVSGPFKVLVDANGVMKVGFVLTQQESIEAIKHRYDFVLGPGTWQDHNPSNNQPGWAWHRDGVELVLQDLTSSDGAVLIGVSLLPK